MTKSNLHFGLNIYKLNRFPGRYDLIISNPPWIVGSPLSNEEFLEQGNYDEKELFL